MLNRITRVAVVCLSMCLAPVAGAQVDNDVMAQLEAIETFVLTDSEVSTWLVAAKELDRLDFDDSELNFESLSPADMQAVFSANGDAMAIIEQNGFTAESFSNVGMNLMLAIGAAEMAGQQAEIDAALAQLEAAKGQMPAAQYDMMVAQITAVQQLFAKVPPENIALAQKYEQQIAELE